ncbi:hypothetical protein [Piscibacillus halophilus]|uniref:SatD family (SatD) n=1 Tax=Piscibacillus halophilus TaxID=571933 RepID=A0A1H9ILW2_9BACI|nr:hypothetical protein [Piscibacillus halophilus]SEQ75590.1 hypothetical protein SAMN05216362_12542 [Piscibacillus halophilus]
MSHYYTCIAVDVVKSQDQKLDQVEAYLTDLKEYLNRKFSERLTIYFDIRKGDELIGVLSRFSDAYRILRAIEKFTENKPNFTFYIGCGFGTIDTKNKESIHIANGSAIINALYARDELIKQGDREAKIWEFPKQHKIYFYTKDFPYSSINALYYMISQLINKRSEKQKAIVQAVRENPDMTYEEIGNKFGYKSPKTSVSNHLYAANFELVAESEKSLLQLLDFHQNQLEQNK